MNNISDEKGEELANLEGLELVIEELDERSVMPKFACACSTTCNCTSCSCAAWTL